MISDSASHRILIVEDDDAMSVALRDGFESEGYRVLHSRDGRQGLDLARQEKPELLVLDVMLPSLSVLDVCRQLRSEENLIPIIMLTARGQEVDRVLGLKLGADDYVTKPFSLMELFARVENVLRRCYPNPSRSGQIWQFGDFQLDFRRHQAEKGACDLNLSAREFLILDYFVQHRGQVISRDQLLDAVWGYDSIPFTRTVDTHIAKLRKKIENDPAHPRLLVTVHRLGYKLTG